MDNAASLKWRTIDVEALCPDTSVRDAAQELAISTRWSRLGCDGAIVWGECRGGDRRPDKVYRVAVDQTPDKPTASKLYCSCPSRKRPCKHALGLLLLAGLERLEQGVPGADPVEWVRAASRQGRREGKRVAPGTPIPVGVTLPTPSVSARTSSGRSAANREARVRAGLDDLERWLGDLIDRGLAAGLRAGGALDEDCELMASRLVASQAPALARRLRRLISIKTAAQTAADGALEADWAERTLEELGMLQLAVESFRSLHRLSEVEQADLRVFVGWSRRREEALATPGIHDRWLVLGSTLEREPPLVVSRTWLTGLKTDRPALLIDYEAGSEPGEHGEVNVSIRPGMVLSGELHFFPSGAPLRALPGKMVRAARSGAASPVTIGDALRRFAVALAGNPWLDLYPFFLAGVVPAKVSGQWLVVDRHWAGLPLSSEGRSALTGWRLLALGGAEPLDLFGEWDGRVFRPLTAFRDQRPVVMPA